MLQGSMVKRMVDSCTTLRRSRQKGLAGIAYAAITYRRVSLAGLARGWPEIGPSYLIRTGAGLSFSSQRYQG